MGRTLTDHLDPATGPKRILALDGGGVKGILTLGMLDVLEAELRRRSGNPDLALSDYFDLIGGTSTGAIIAAGLAIGKSTGELIHLYRELGPQVFGKTRGDGFFIGSRYDSKALKAALWPVLDKKTLGSQLIRTGLALHAKRIDTGSPWVLTNNPGAPFFDPPNLPPDQVPNKDYRVIDVVMASAAAPTFFDEVKIPMAYDRKDRPTAFGYFVDGAVGGFNNPSVQLLLTALVPVYGFGWKPGANNLMMASFGTGSRRPEVEGRKFAGQGPAFRGISALKAMIYDTQMQGIMLMQAMSNSQRPWKINSEVGDLEGACITPEPLLDYQRIDVLLEQKKGRPRRGEALARTSIEKLLDRELDPKVLESVDQLANGHPENMKLLLEIGRRAAPAYIDARWPNPAFDLPEWKVAAAAG
jgi:predicted acylesterase/phospholipase RssA